MAQRKRAFDDLPEERGEGFARPARAGADAAPVDSPARSLMGRLEAALAVQPHDERKWPAWGSIAVVLVSSMMLWAGIAAMARAALV